MMLNVSNGIQLWTVMFFRIVIVIAGNTRSDY